MFNKSAIMTRAWEIVRKGQYSARMFRRALMAAWHEAKQAVSRATMTEADCIREVISMLENKDTWADADYAQMGKLRANLAVAEGHEQAAQDYAEKRELIAAAAGRFCSVTFIKADGSLRTMQVQPATLQRHVRGDKASTPARPDTRTCCQYGTPRPRPRVLSIWQRFHGSQLMAGYTNTTPDFSRAGVNAPHPQHSKPLT